MPAYASRNTKLNLTKHEINDQINMKTRGNREQCAFEEGSKSYSGINIFS